MNTENEIWKPVTVDNYGSFYHVSNCGRLKRLGKFAKTDGHFMPEIILWVGVTNKGYNRCILREKGKKNRSFYLHRLIALAFLDAVEGKTDVNHKDGNKLNNHVSNLEWCTPQENNEHGFQTGLLKRGITEKPFVSQRTEWSFDKPVIDPDTGIFWHLSEVARMVGTSKNYMAKMLRGEKRNKTKYQYA